MHVFDYRFLRSRSVDPDVLNRAVNIGIIKARTAPDRRKGTIMEALERKAIIMSVTDSNAIEGIRTSEVRMVGLMADKVAPRGHEEREIAGYRDALRFIHRNHGTIPVDKASILRIYGILMGYSETDPPSFKSRDNVIVDREPDGTISAVYPTVPSEETEAAVDQMVWAFAEARNDPDINKLLLIPCFVMDFLRIHPFLDGNGRMSRLLTVLLLYQEGYDVCRYVSMESKINAAKQDYYRSLEESQKGWFENNCDYGPFISFFLGQLFLCYRDLDRYVGEGLSRSKKSDALETYLRMCSVPVSKSELKVFFPSLSETTVERTLKAMCDSGEIVRVGNGKASRYVAAARKVD